MEFINSLRKKSLPYLLAISLAVSILSGCKEHKTEYSEPKHEEATVIYKHHRVSWMQPIPCGKSFTYIIHPARYDTTFTGSIEFEVNDSQIFNRFEEKDLADVTYREVYKLTYDDLDGDGKKELLERKLKEYEFLDAQPIKK